MSRQINDVSDALIVIDEQGLIQRINPVAASLFGYACEELIGRMIRDILPPTRQNPSEEKGIVFEILNGRVESVYKKGLKKNGLSFPVDLFVVPNADGTYTCVVKDDTSRFFHEQIETMANVVLRRVLIGEKLEHFAAFILEQLREVFPFPLLWIGQYEKDEKGVLVLSSLGGLSQLAAPRTLFTHSDQAVHPAVLACERMETVSDEVADEHGRPYKMIAFPFLSKKAVVGVLTVLAPKEHMNHIILNRFENIALRLGMILQISEDQKFLRLLSTAISSAMNAVFITDQHGKLMWANEAFTRLTGYGFEEVVGRHPSFLYSGLQPPEFYKEMWSNIKAGRSWRGELVDRHKDGSLFTIEQMITPILDYEGRVTHYVAVYDDLTARKDAEGKIMHLSNYDQLTGLPNRSLFHEKLKQILLKAAKMNECVAVLFVDISNFNRVNDTLGHAAGDQILKLMADRILSCVTSKDWIARIDGDEFAVILRDVKQPDEIGDLAHQIIRRIQEPIKMDKDEIVLGGCAGIALFPYDTTDSEKLINYADMTLFKAKKAGPNSYFFFSQQLNNEIEERLKLEQDMRKALVQNEFFLNYQPQVDLKTGRVSGWEALVRWKHPQKGLIPPNLFISAAEDTGLIVPLFLFVLEEAVKQLKAWNKMGYRDMTMAVNVSSAQFEDIRLTENIQNILKKYRVKAKSIELELTESLLMKDVYETQQILTHLSDNGVRIAIDDFGTGYSSLNYLRRFPVNKLKIDRSFVKDIDTAKENIAIVKAIISLGHILGLEVVAEGVENAKQLHLLKRLDCDSIQGFFLGVPMSADDATLFLQKKNKAS